MLGSDEERYVYPSTWLRTPSLWKHLSMLSGCVLCHVQYRLCRSFSLSDISRRYKMQWGNKKGSRLNVKAASALYFRGGVLTYRCKLPCIVEDKRSVNACRDISFSV